MDICIWLRKRKIDTCIDLELFSRYSGLLAGFAGADNIVAFNNFHGEGLYKGNMVTHKVMLNIKKNKSASKAFFAFCIAGSTSIALPISESSIKSIFLGLTFFLGRPKILKMAVPIKQSGTPIAGVYMIARAFGVDLPLYAFMVIMPPVILLTIIPISLAGWGVREVSMVSLLSYSGIAQETALSISIIFGFTYVIQGLLGLYFFINSKKEINNES